MFHHTSKHLEVCQKHSATRRIFNSLLHVCKCGQTQSFMFDIYKNAYKDLLLTIRFTDSTLDSQFSDFLPRTRVNFSRSFPLAARLGFASVRIKYAKTYCTPVLQAKNKKGGTTEQSVISRTSHATTSC